MLRRTFTACLFVPLAAVHAQGLLDPPGPPAPSMKTLQEVEPRTPISRLPFKIEKAGSYYLTADLTGERGLNGITIAADDVSIDLKGFTLRGVEGSLDGILIDGEVRNVSVRDGGVRDWGQSGIAGAADENCRFLNLHLTGNGVDGLNVHTGCQVRNCLARGNTSAGLRTGPQAHITDSVCRENGTGIEAGERSTVSRCKASGSTVHGIVARDGSLVENCTATENSQIGIAALEGSSIRDCLAESNWTDGIQVSSGCVVRNNTCRNNGFSFFGAGVRVTGDENRIEGNHLTGADRGLWITGTKNRVAGNTVLENTENYIIAAGNHLNLLLSEIPETISWPATVELAATLTGVLGQHGISVDSSEVTIDLKGHSLVGVAGSLNGITVVNQTPDHTNITVRNGTVKGWGGDGLNAIYAWANSFESVVASGNAGDGIVAGGGVTSGQQRAVIVKDCQAIANGGDGISVSTQCTVVNCQATHNTGNGIRVVASCLVQDCVASQNQQSGIRAQNDSRIIGNVCDDNSVDGIRIVSGDTRVDRNHVTDNDGAGINCSSSGALVIRNTAASNDINYMFASNNKHGPIVNLQSTNGDISGVAFSNHPWANFEF